MAQERWALTDEELEAMYEDYIANYGEVLDAQFCNGAR